MALFRRKKLETREVEGHPDLVAVRQEDVDVLIEQIGDEVFETINEAELPKDILQMLQVGFFYMFERDPSQVPHATAIAGQTIARVGYLSRAIEFEKFESAREAPLELFDMLEDWLSDPSFGGDSMLDTFVEGAARLAVAEPLDAGPDDPAVMWLIPGLGAAVRSELADYMTLGVCRPGPDGRPTLPEGTTREELKRVWMYGFILRTFVECMNEERLN